MRNHIQMPRWTIMIAVVVVVLAVPLSIASRLWAEEEKSSDAEPSNLAAVLIGTWQLLGAPPEANALKSFTGKHWNVTYADESGNVIHNHGGTYKLDGDQYEETVKYATEGVASLIGQTFKFKIKVDGDNYSQEGVGNPYNEQWMRAE